MALADREFFRLKVTEPIASSRAELVREMLRSLPRSGRQVREVLRLLILLQRVGWHASLGSSYDDPDPSPWMNLAATAYLASICVPGAKVVEYGCGSSTLWMAGRGCNVTSIEHDAAWAERVRAKLTQSGRTANCQVLVVDEAEYSSAPATAGCSNADLVIVDGIDRVNCVKSGIELLGPSGVLALDDSHRPDYDEAFAHMRQLGFSELTLWGPKFGQGGGTPTTTFFTLAQSHQT